MGKGGKGERERENEENGGERKEGDKVCVCGEEGKGRKEGRERGEVCAKRGERELGTTV